MKKKYNELGKINNAFSQAVNFKTKVEKRFNRKPEFAKKDRPSFNPTLALAQIVKFTKQAETAGANLNSTEYNKVVGEVRRQNKIGRGGRSKYDGYSNRRIDRMSPAQVKFYTILCILALLLVSCDTVGEKSTTVETVTITQADAVAAPPAQNTEGVSSIDALATKEAEEASSVDQDIIEEETPQPNPKVIETPMPESDVINAINSSLGLENNNEITLEATPVAGINNHISIVSNNAGIMYLATRTPDGINIQPIEASAYDESDNEIIFYSNNEAGTRVEKGRVSKEGGGYTPTEGVAIAAPPAPITDTETITDTIEIEPEVVEVDPSENIELAQAAVGVEKTILSVNTFEMENVLSGENEQFTIGYDQNDHSIARYTDEEVEGEFKWYGDGPFSEEQLPSSNFPCSVNSGNTCGFAVRISETIDKDLFDTQNPDNPALQAIDGNGNGHELYYEKIVIGHWVDDNGKKQTAAFPIRVADSDGQRVNGWRLWDSLPGYNSGHFDALLRTAIYYQTTDFHEDVEFEYDNPNEVQYNSAAGINPNAKMPIEGFGDLMNTGVKQPWIDARNNVSRVAIAGLMYPIATTIYDNEYGFVDTGDIKTLTDAGIVLMEIGGIPILPPYTSAFITDTLKE